MCEAQVKILPCPFCGRENVSKFKNRGYGWSVACGCSAMGPIGYPREQAVELWNKRAKQQHDPVMKIDPERNKIRMQCATCGEVVLEENIRDGKE